MTLEKTLDDWGFPNSPCDMCHPGEMNEPRTNQKVPNFRIDRCPGEANCPLYIAWKARIGREAKSSCNVHEEINMQSAMEMSQELTKTKMATKDKMVMVKYICSPCGYLFRDMKRVPIPESVICPDCGKELHGTRQTNMFANVSDISYLWFEYR